LGLWLGRSRRRLPLTLTLRAPARFRVHLAEDAEVVDLENDLRDLLLGARVRVGAGVRVRVRVNVRDRVRRSGSGEGEG